MTGVTAPATTRWRQLGLIAGVQILAMSAWFSTAAVVPSLERDWHISKGDASWLTTTVQLGFVAGALLSAFVNLPDRVRPPVLIVGGSIVAGLANLFLAAFADDLGSALPARVLTGVALACVYPTGVKLIAGWFERSRGFAMGAVVGALTLGSALPYLVGGLGYLPWRGVLVVTSVLTLSAAVLALWLREGPHARTGAPLRLGYLLTMLADRRQRLINIGYVGHMWELYALWAWMPAYLAASLASRNGDAASDAIVGLASFGAIGVAGAAGCVAAGLASRLHGSERVALWALVASTACCALSVVAYGASPAVLVVLSLVWGSAVVADSAQFSAALSRASDQRWVGTALTAQMALGFITTTASIHLVPLAEGLVGWQWALSILAPGPLIAAVAMRALGRMERTCA